MKKTFNLKELATYLGVSVRTIQRMIDDGRFPVKPVPDLPVKRWSVELIDAWLTSQPEE